MEDIYFYRWGNLNPVKHKEARLPDSEKTMHIAPVVKGIYAFPRGFVERFLIGGSYTDHSTKFLLDENGNKILDNDFWELYPEVHVAKKYVKYLKKKHIRIKDISCKYDEEKKEHYVTYKVRPKKFRYTGDIWHHLIEYVDPKDIIDKTESWVKTNFSVYCKALHKCDTIERFDSYLGKDWGKKEWHGDPHTYPNNFSKDHYEVFIEHVK